MNSINCSFFKKTGEVVFNNINIITGEPTLPLMNCLDGEVINHEEIYIDINTKKIYHKSHNINILDDSTSDIERYLLWKETSKGDWDWFITDYCISDAMPVNEYYNFTEFKKNPDHTKNIDIIKMKCEILTNTYIITKKYNIDNLNTIELNNYIKETIDGYIDNI